MVAKPTFPSSPTTHGMQNKAQMALAIMKKSLYVRASKLFEKVTTAAKDTVAQHRAQLTGMVTHL
jgi:hypothetical protein